MRFSTKSMLTMIFVFILIFVLSCQVAKAQTTTVSVKPQTNSVNVGQNLVVTVEVDNVQNLYGVDFTVDYNNAILQLVNSQPDLGSSNIPGGVLYGSQLTTDSSNIPANSVYYNTSLSTANEYHLYATSAAPAQAFSGSGTIVTLTFSVLSAGQTSLVLSSTLADHPATGETSQEISHNDISATVTATSGSTSSSPSSSSSPKPTSTGTSTGTSSSPTATVSSSSTPSTPEFPLMATVVIVLALISFAALAAKKKSGTKLFKPKA